MKTVWNTFSRSRSTISEEENNRFGSGNWIKVFTPDLKSVIQIRFKHRIQNRLFKQDLDPVTKT